MHRPQTEWLFREQWDPSARKHHGNPASVEAHERAALGKREMYERILAFIRSKGDIGATVHELCEHLTRELGRPVYPNHISGRLAELKAGKVLFVKIDHLFQTVRRNGAAALIVGDDHGK